MFKFHFIMAKSFRKYKKAKKKSRKKEKKKIEKVDPDVTWIRTKFSKFAAKYYTTELSLPIYFSVEQRSIIKSL